MKTDRNPETLIVTWTNQSTIVEIPFKIANIDDIFRNDSKISKKWQKINFDWSGTKMKQRTSIIIFSCLSCQFSRKLFKNSRKLSSMRLNCLDEHQLSTFFIKFLEYPNKIRDNRQLFTSFHRFFLNIPIKSLDICSTFTYFINIFHFTPISFFLIQCSIGFCPSNLFLLV